MADAPKILGTDSLRQAYPKLNNAIDLVNGFQTQLDTIVIEGDSSVEAAQARISSDGTSYSTLKERLDTQHSTITNELDNATGSYQNLRKKIDIYGLSPLDFGAKGDGITNDTNAFNQIENTYSNVLVSLDNKTYKVDVLPSKNTYRNGNFLVGSALYPSKDQFTMSTKKLTSNNRYSAWTQDKSFYHDGKTYLLYNEGSDHVTNDLKVVLRISEDDGQTFSSSEIVYADKSYSGGATAWAAGTDGTRIYVIVRLRGANYNIGTTKHLLIYRAIGNTTWTSKEISVNNGTEVPILYHSFASLPDGSLAFGYHFSTGEVGVAKTFNFGDTWTTYKLYNGAEMGGRVLLCEPSLYYDSTNGMTIGFLRTEDKATRLPEFFVSLDNCQTFTKYATDIPIEKSPIPIVKNSGYFYALVTERYDECKVFMLKGAGFDVKQNGYSAFQRYFIGNLNYSGKSVSSGVGVASGVSIGNKIVWFYSSEEANGAPNIYATTIHLNPTFTPSLLKNNIADNISSYRSNEDVVTFGTSDLGVGWTLNTSGEGSTVNGVPKAVLTSDGTVHLDGYLDASSIANAMFVLPSHIQPKANKKIIISVNDNTFGVLFIRGSLSTGTKGEVKLLAPTTVPLAKVSLAGVCFNINQ